MLWTDQNDTGIALTFFVFFENDKILLLKEVGGLLAAGR